MLDVLVVRQPELDRGVARLPGNRHGFNGIHVVGAPVVADYRVYVSSRSGILFALDRSTGKKLWEFKTAAAIETSPSVAAQTVFVGDYDGRLYAIDAATGKSQWEIEIGGPISSTPVIADGVIYLSSLNGTLYAIQ